MDRTKLRRAAAIGLAGSLPLLVGACDLLFGPDRRPTTIVVAPGSVSFDAVGDSHTLTAEVFDQDGAAMPNVEVTWTSSDPSVATVTLAGVVVASGNGSATIYASVRSVSGEASASVSQIPTSMVPTAGLDQIGPAGELLPTLIEVLVTDRLGSPAVGFDVGFAVIEGAGSLEGGAPVTGFDGLASVAWRLGQVAGSAQTVEAHLPSPVELRVSFTADAVAGSPDRVVKQAGDEQAAQRQAPLAEPLTARVIDRFDNPVQGALVTWSVLSGGGSSNPEAAMTDASGEASTIWNLGMTLGDQELTANVEGVAEGAVFTAFAFAVPDRIQVVEGNGQTATVGQAVAVIPTVLVLDAGGLPVPQVPVSFVVETGGGSLGAGSANQAVPGGGSAGGPALAPNLIVESDESGLAGPDAWLLGTVAGENRLRVLVDGVLPALFTAIGTPGPPVMLEKVSGDLQVAATETTLPFPLVTRVTDVFGNPVPGTLVQFQPTGGSGSVAPPVTPTQANGTASAFWTLGDLEGGQEVLAAFTGSDPVSFTATAVAGGGGGGGGPGFNIVYEYVSPVDAGVQAIFASAASRWSTVITGDLPQVTIPAGACGSAATTSSLIDDLYVVVAIGPNDGPGGILGSAGPCLVRTVGALPAVGSVNLDEADVANLLAQGRLEDVILHELGHILGVGALWDFGPFFFLQDPSLPNNPGADTHFTGPAAIAAFNAVGGGTYVGAKVPVENVQGGPGTRDSHWRESVLEDELMTGFLSGGSSPLSRVTAASLIDLCDPAAPPGACYQIDLGAADPFVLPAPGPPLAAPRAPGGLAIEEIVLPPIGTVDASGQIRPLP